MTAVYELPSPVKAGEGGKRKDPTAALRARRHRARKAAANAGTGVTVAAVKASDARVGRGKTVNQIKADVTVSRSPGHAVDVAAYAAAIALAGAAAWFSIRGMVVLFPGAPLTVVGMRSLWKGPSS
jgi:hypothetical protein